MLKVSKENIKRDYKRKYLELHGMEVSEGDLQCKYEALGALIKEYVAEMWLNTKKNNEKQGEKQVYYFSMEFLLGRLLGDNLLNLGIREEFREALGELQIDLTALEELEQDQGLGNGGLGRLAACFLDSMASLGIAGNGCGIRYKYGFFEQKIIDGCQVEAPDTWLKNGNVWERKRADKGVIVKFGGQVIPEMRGDRLCFKQVGYEPVLAVPYDTPVVGYENQVVNTLRLWSAEPVKNEFDFASFSRGEFLKAIEYRNSVEAICQVLYPEDSFEEGKKLRLKQQYFFVSAGVQSIIRHYKKSHKDIRALHKAIAIHINDTHPTLVIPELMRILMDEEGLSWQEAWHITNKVCGYTNHTLLAEALEKWPVEMVKELLPRIFMIIEEINKKFCEELWNNYPGQWEKIHKMAIVADGYVKMAHLAIAGSHSVNGVAKLHSEIMIKQEMADFYDFTPEKFNNKTNGITHRRWLLKSNPQLTELLKETIGEKFIKNPMALESFEAFKDDKSVQQRLHSIKRSNKEKLADIIYKNQGIIVNPDSIFDVQVKRLHAYKRQSLNILRVMELYNEILANPHKDIAPRTVIFAGKSAPGYYLAKKTIELINAVADKINKDPRVKDMLKVVFMENYRVSLAESIIPAADLSEQISTATKEASGTSNMKFMMNGALTIATLDGANVEIRDQVGDDNIFLFGLREEEVLKYYSYGGYNSIETCQGDIRLQRITEDLISGKYSANKERFASIYEHLLTYNDEYFVLKDFASYLKAQERVDRIYRDQSLWQSKAIINIAKSGIFSSDRTISQYAEGIWGVKVI